MNNSLRPGLSRAEYEKIDALNFSTLKWCRKSPAHARHRQLHPQPPTPAQALGTLVHCYLLEPDRFARDYVELPDLTQNLKTKNGETPKNPTATAEYKARLAEFGQAHMGQTFVTPEEMAVLRGIGEGIAAHPVAADLLSGGERELACVWENPTTSLPCKGLIDWIADGGAMVADLKTTDDASPAAFARQAALGCYHVQAAWYLWGLSEIGNPARRFLHIAVETSPPYAVAVYELDDAALDQGLRLARTWLHQWAACVKAGRWDAYPDRVEPLSLPRYAFTKDGLE